MSEIVDEEVPPDPHEAPRRAWRWVVAALGVGAASALVWYRTDVDAPPAEAAPPDGPSPADAPVPVVGALVADGPFAVQVRADGRLAPWRSAEITPAATGVLAALPVELGSAVRQGAVLFRIDDAEARLDVAEAEAELVKAQSEFEAGQRGSRYAEALDSLRRQTLNELGIEDVGDAGGNALPPASVLSARTGVAQAEQRLAQARLALARTAVRAPFSGRVSTLEVERGEYISPGEAALTLVQDTRLKAVVEVLEADIVGVRVGAPAVVRVPSAEAVGGGGYPARVFAIDPVVDPEAGVGRVVLELLTRDRDLRPGLFVEALIQTNQVPAHAVVPVDAVLERGGRPLVFLLRDGLARWSYVDPVARDETAVALLSGVEPGDTVAVAGHTSLADETRVRVDSLRRVPRP